MKSEAWHAAEVMREFNTCSLVNMTRVNKQASKQAFSEEGNWGGGGQKLMTHD